MCRINDMKRMIALLLVLILVFSLAACGKGKTAETKPTEQEEISAKPDAGENTEPEPSWWELNVAGNPDLILVNKTHPVESDYWPDDMVTIERHVEGVGNADTHKMRQVAADALNKMFDAAEADGIYLRLRTGFRSYDYQKSLFESYVKNHGEAEANRFSARPGESEHQTGLACDVGGKSQGYALSYEFGKTDEGKWVREHCAEYGFILRYLEEKEDVTGYVFEPWHIRYVGAEHAENMMKDNMTLEEYLGSFR